MIIWSNHLRAAAVAAFAFFTVSCDGGEPSRTADELAADSALAADLALANRDTLLVDSIGAYREPDAAERDTDLAGAMDGDSVRLRDVTPSFPPGSPAVNPAAKPTATVPPAGSSPATTARPDPPAATKPAASAPAAPRLTGIRACSSPGQENQTECIRVSIATGDARLNRV